ncbi:MAG: amidase [Rhizobiales bacterium]|nr:amidase [Hyphomicrobiales bacterium]
MSRSRHATLAEISQSLATGKVTARQLAEESLSRIADPAGEGARAFIHVDPAQVMHDADAQDALRRAGREASPFAGIPFAIKDLFDVAGEVTAAGSVLLANERKAETDSDAVAAMKRAGFVALGRTNMTEFAYSGVGINPHHGTPLSVYGRSERRIPGGSSSGSAVAVAEAMCPVALGTDTGGSCRIPAAFNGIVGYKPSAQRVSRRGVFPLSGSFDSVGPIANSVSCCAAVDALLAGEVRAEIRAGSGPLVIGVLKNHVLDGLDDDVARDFEAALSGLRKAGHRLVDITFPDLAEMPSLLVNGGIVAAEAWAIHAPMVARHEAEYDPRVVSRIRFGQNVTAEELARLRQRRSEMIGRFAALANGYDAIACPAVPVIPPRIDELAAEADYRRLNGLCLRNTYVFNFLDACAISLPMQEEGAAPTGLMLARPNGGDAALFAAALMVEQVLG